MTAMLPDGLILRTATTEDAEGLAAFNAEMHGGDQYRQWALDLFDRHPTVSLDDIFVISKSDGEIVSSAMIIPQRWRYREVDIGVGQVEAVATRPDYRRQGLVRHFDT
ncbi:MAG: GNAT family N-acetyltransferase [Egibacteraceae bacterium]